MAKKTKRIFDPEIYIVTFGGNEYEISPQPIERVIKFQQAIEELLDSLSDFSTKYFVIDEDGNRYGPYDDSNEAEAVANGNNGSVEEERAGVEEFLNAIVVSPYYAFKVVVPDLVEDDVKRSSFPELKNALDVVVEVNGIGWLESFVKKTISPMIPEIMSIIVKSTQEVLADSTGTIAE